jgi:hypothetical protein
MQQSTAQQRHLRILSKTSPCYRCSCHEYFCCRLCSTTSLCACSDPSGPYKRKPLLPVAYCELTAVELHSRKQQTLLQGLLCSWQKCIWYGSLVLLSVPAEHAHGTPLNRTRTSTWLPVVHNSVPPSLRLTCPAQDGEEAFCKQGAKAFAKQGTCSSQPYAKEQWQSSPM